MPPAKSPDLKRVMTAAGLTILAVLVAIACLVAFSARSIDTLSRQNEQKLIERALERELARISEDVTSAAIWSDAYFALLKRDGEWLHTNLGAYYADYMGHEVTITYGSDGAALYASRDAEFVDPSTEKAVIDAGAGLLARVRDQAMKQRFDAAGVRTVEFAAAVSQNGFVAVGPDIYALSVSNIVPERLEAGLSDGPDGAVLSGRRLTPLLESLTTDLGIASPKIVESNDRTSPSVYLTGPDGEPLAVLTWTPATPGVNILNNATMLILIVALALGGAAMLLFRQVARIVDRLARNRAALTDSLAELTVARDAAQAANLAKSQFLASMSHEIRTPLNGILGMAQSLTASELRKADREKVDIILASGQNLTTILNDVLDISKIEAGKLEIAPVPMDVVALARQTVSLFAPLAAEKGLRLDLRPDHVERAWLQLDPVRVQQCLSNLVSNAIKFTQAGEVTITLGVQSCRDRWRVSLAVRDTGIGMSDVTMARLFDNFVQADASTTRMFGGTGLGRSISRRLARLMDGDVVVESTVGSGSTFTLTILANSASEIEMLDATGPGEIEAVAPARTVRGSRVMIVDDNAVNRQVVKLFLADQGFDFSEATNGKEALDLLCVRQFDLVLLDVHMPVMDGRECIRRIRASDAAWASIPVIALTAEAMQGDRESLLAVGMTDYASKPIDKATLITKVVRCLQAGSEQVAPAPVRRKDIAPAMSDDDLDALFGEIDAAVG
jgi:signal transduction histidine kinase/FixJ family two-component response regulator